MATILLVEDHGATRHTVRAALVDAGFLVFEAKDGASALALMKRHKPSLVIQDLVLPDIDGFVLAGRLREQAGELPLRLIAFSGLISNLDAQRIAEANFDDVITKPILPSRLVELVRAHWRDAQRAHAEPLRVLKRVAGAGDVSRPLSPLASNDQHPGAGYDGELLRRCSELSAELTVMRSLSQAVLAQDDMESALVNALSACFDASYGAFGALYLCDLHSQLRARPLGGERYVEARTLAHFFGHEAWLREAMRRGAMVRIEDADWNVRDSLRRVGIERALVVPLRRHESALGALFVSLPPEYIDRDQETFDRFVQRVGEQLAHALALAEAFRAREYAEREAEQQRRLARDQAAVWRALVDCAPDVVMLLDAQARVRFINRMPVGLAPERAQSVFWYDLFAPEHHPDMKRALAAVFSRGASEVLEIGQAGPGDAMTWTESHLGPVRNAGEVTGALVIQRDMSAKKLAESKLMMADHMVTIGSLAAAISHEVNNPLASLLANLELALRDAEELGPRVPPELLDGLRDAGEAALRVRGIVRDLAVFSRSPDDEFGPIDVARVLDSALRMAWNEVRQRATLQRELNRTPPIYGNESRLGQALLGLILHAAHGIAEGDPEHHTIRVQLDTDNLGRVVVTVTDSGPSLPAASRARLLKPYSSSRPPASGDALGLALCQRVCSEHGGNITIESLEHGNRLRVVLPACNASPPEVERPPDSEIRALRRGRVLVIDDERLITQVVRRALVREHDVVTLDNAADALRGLEAGERYDAIVCDLMMSGMSGMEFHRHVSEEFPDLAERIIFFTGGAFTPRAREFLRQVPNPRVEKPIAGHALRAVVNGMVR